MRILFCFIYFIILLYFKLETSSICDVDVFSFVPLWYSIHALETRCSSAVNSPTESYCMLKALNWRSAENFVFGSQAYLLEDHQEEVDGGFLRSAVQHDTPQLPLVSLVKTAARSHLVIYRVKKYTRLQKNSQTHTTTLCITRNFPTKNRAIL